MTALAITTRPTDVRCVRCGALVAIRGPGRAIYAKVANYVDHKGFLVLKCACGKRTRHKV